VSTATSTLAFTEEQQQFREIVARFLAEKSPISRVRTVLDETPRYDADTWQALAGELGATGLHVPEALGGAGFGAVELGIVVEEMGRHLYTGPYFASAVMACNAVLGADEAARAELLPGFADGSTIGALVLDALDDPARLGHALRAGPDDSTIDGIAPIVLGADAANLLVVLARSGDGLALYTVDPAAATIEPLEVLDPTRPLSRVRFDGAPARRIGTFGARHMSRLWYTLSIFLSHELLGAAESLLYSTVEYMQLRVQFGRAIASFQALKHRCADLLMEVELAKALVHEASRVLQSGQHPAEITHMAKAMASDAAMSAARAAIQLRGGIGFTWENDTHFYFKRIKSSEVLFGSPARHREWLMTELEAADHAE
jgi:alkylation response protein AidB-like acyl-CoA dehydrogenase